MGEKTPTVIETGKIYKDGKLYMPHRIRKELHLTETDTIIWQVHRMPNGQKYIILSTEIVPIPTQGFSIHSVN